MGGGGPAYRYHAERTKAAAEAASQSLAESMGPVVRRAASSPEPTHTGMPGVRDRLPLLWNIPTAEVLSHGRYRLGTRMHFFGIADQAAASATGATAPMATTELEYRFPFVSEVVLGLEDRAQVGFEFGDDFSASLSAWVMRDRQYWPDLVVGARQLFSSQEGRLYGIDGNARDRMRGEVFIMAGKTVTPYTRIHLGGTAIGQLDDGKASVVAGVEQSLGAGFHLGYSLFQRFGHYHHDVTTTWSYGPWFSLSLSFTEFQSWVYQEERWGFFTTPAGSPRDAYRSRGIGVTVHLAGWVARSDQVSMEERLAMLERELHQERQRAGRVEQRVVRLGGAVEGLLSTQRMQDEGGAKRQTLEYLDMIQKRKAAGALFDPEILRDLTGRIARLGQPAQRVLSDLVADPTADPGLKAQACIVMGDIQDPLFTQPLLQAVADPEPEVRKEAILALGRIGNKVAEPYARELLKDRSEPVALAARQALILMGVEKPTPPPLPPKKPPPPKPINLP